MFGLKPEKLETQVRLCRARINLQKNKKNFVVKQMRKDVADLLRNGKQEHARIRVEGVLREQLLLQAYEILELYLELLAVRSQLVAKNKEIPRDMVEGVSSLVYAAQRISDVPELQSLRKLLAAKYGDEYVREASGDVTCTRWQVNAALIRCLLVEPPLPEDRLQALSDIAQEHGVEWDLDAAARDLLPPTAAAAPAALAAPPPHPHDPATLDQTPAATAPLGGVVDPHQAAAAAAAAAAHARAMAEWAASLAQGTQGGPSFDAAPHQGPPPQGWLASSVAASSAFVPQGPPQPAGRTEEDIQRAYDAAVGPPAKGPSAPQAAAAPTPAALPLPPPPPPPPAPALAAPGAPAEEEDAYDELSKRLEALKHSR